VKRVALDHALPVLEPAGLRDPAAIPWIAGWRPDLLVVVAYGKILPRAVLEIPRLGSINLHASLLPRHRGAAPIQWALLRGDPVTGNTTMLMDEGMDTGDILLTETLEIAPDETAGELSLRLARSGAPLLLETLRRFVRGQIVPRHQPEGAPGSGEEPTLAPKIGKEQASIDWTRPADEIHGQVRGLAPWPGAVTALRGEPVKILRTSLPPVGTDGPVPASLERPAGTLLATGRDGILVQTGSDGAILVRELKPAGKRGMAAADFLRGRGVRLGERWGLPGSNPAP
jgi:methionyl-tRNA formyltransferase